MIYTVEDIMDGLVAYLRDYFSVCATKRYFRAASDDLTASPRWYVEPSSFEYDRSVNDAVSCRYRLRLIVEQSVDARGVSDAVSQCVEKLRAIGRGAVKKGWIDAAKKAFVERVDAFSDAPCGYSVETLEGGVSAVFGGLEITFAVA